MSKHLAIGFFNMLMFVNLQIFAELRIGHLYIDELCPLINNQTGICSVLNMCASAQYELQVLRKKPGLCGFDHSTPIVCCDTTKQTTTEKIEFGTKPTISTSTSKHQDELTTNNSIQINNRISVNQKKCQLYGNNVYRNQSSPTLLPGILYEVINSCNVEELFQRNEVISGEYPHLVSIGYSSVANPIYKCTGALISEEYVLTTATCTSINYGVPHVVRLGTTIKQEFYFEYPQVQHIEVREFVKHPRYNERSKKNDIALIRLANPATINALTRPACLSEESNLGEAIAVGYGSLSNYGQFGNDIKEDLLHLSQNSACLRMRSGIARDSSWCGQFESNQCVLDGGAPLQVINKTPYCTYSIVGLLSSWDRCDINKAMAVTDVSKYIRWIESYVWS